MRTNNASEEAAMRGELVCETMTLASITRFLDRQEANIFAARMDGKFNHVLGPIESFALGAIPSWVVVVWEW